MDLPPLNALMPCMILVQNPESNCSIFKVVMNSECNTLL